MKKLLIYITIILIPVLMYSQNQAGKDYAILKLSDYKKLFAIHSLVEDTFLLKDTTFYSELCDGYINVHNSKKTPEINGLKNFNYLKTTNEYYKQFMAVKDQNGRKLLWINCIHKTAIEKLTNELVVIADGGYKYFNFWIDLKSKKIINAP